MFQFFIKTAEASTADFYNVVDKVLNVIVNPVIETLFVLATFYFIYNVVKYLVSVDPKDLDRARGGVVNGLIGMFVMISVFGLMQLYLRFIGEGDISVDNGTIKIQTDNKIKFEGLE